jgi:hypothetical protein
MTMSVRALEDVAHRLTQLPEKDQMRVRPLVGDILATISASGPAE